MLKNHKQDRFDGGRAASIVNGPEPAAERGKSFKLRVEQGTQSTDEEARALALAILALEPEND
jgi:hypothetical protein